MKQAQALRQLQHARKLYPVVGEVTGKLWVVSLPNGGQSEFLFSPYRSIWKVDNKIQVIEPASGDEHIINEYNGVKFEAVGSLDCRFPLFRKPKFRVKYQGQEHVLRGRSKAFASPGIDTYVKSNSADFRCDAKFIDPSKPENKGKPIDCQAIVEGKDRFWIQNLHFVVFFLEMDMINTIRKAMS